MSQSGGAHRASTHAHTWPDATARLHASPDAA
jgi:hypothetical protein